MAYGSSGLGFYYPRPAAGQTDERLTVSSSAVPFSSVATWQSSGLVKLVMFDVQSNDVMVTVDGSTPTSTNGHRLYAGQNFTWSMEMAAKAQFIRAGASDGTVHASPLSY
jgi:hypothetical protein